MLHTIHASLPKSGERPYRDVTLDPNAKKVLNIPAWYCFWLVFPIVSTIEGGDYATLSVLLAHGAKLSYSLEDISRADEKRYGELFFVKPADLD